MNASHQAAFVSTAAGPPAVPVSDRTRARLLGVATQVFSEAGYYTATIRDIARRAGTNVAAVNYHFGGKLNLYTEVLKQSLARTARFDSVRKALELDAAPEVVMREAIRARVQMICGDRGLEVRLMMHELAQPSPAMRRVINELTRPVYEQFCELIGRMIGLPPGHEKTRLCTHSVIGQIMHYVQARPIVSLLWPEQKMTPKQLERIADHIADFSLAYLREAGASRAGSAPNGRARSRR